MFALEFIDGLLESHLGLRRVRFQLLNEFLDGSLLGGIKFCDSVRELLEFVHRLSAQSSIYLTLDSSRSLKPSDLEELDRLLRRVSLLFLQ